MHFLRNRKIIHILPHFLFWISQSEKSTNCQSSIFPFSPFRLFWINCFLSWIFWISIFFNLTFENYFSFKLTPFVSLILFISIHFGDFLFTTRIWMSVCHAKFSEVIWLAIRSDVIVFKQMYFKKKSILGLEPATDGNFPPWSCNSEEIIKIFWEISVSLGCYSELLVSNLFSNFCFLLRVTMFFGLSTFVLKKDNLKCYLV